MRHFSHEYLDLYSVVFIERKNCNSFLRSGNIELDSVEKFVDEK